MSERLRGKIRCDADGCGWSEVVDSLGDWIGELCPNCGVDLLNEADVALIALAETGMKAGLLRNADPESNSPHTFRINTDRRRLTTAEK